LAREKLSPRCDSVTVEPGSSANTAATLYEEEISDVSLSTFYVFDHENAGAGMFVGVAKKPQNQARRIAADITKVPELLGAYDASAASRDK
jgi:hypothetical protein